MKNMGVGLLLGLLIASVIAAGSQIISLSDHGRWQIVNPTPTYRGETVLLDTDTGMAFARCTIQGDEPNAPGSGWCSMIRD